ncbi:roadblock/LC7 domain-containing protein [Plasticicumulans lactativorans]|uniref:Roadblock/LC7 domain-containing protein n=1 Tax=Plasticicumulans lactativorans TaxID=1133106 RepID=A0A4R2LV28_9GAMM|nr:DUF2173 family protein [Plasticicumulans lactativorans]TCO83770.1 roadblock/LC7 domain-containing protein [Plasticicumulans lactativorans]
MIKRLLALDGVLAVCRFRDDGSLVESYGGLATEKLAALSDVAHDYRRMVQGQADQVSMFTGMRGWTPPRGWVVRGEALTLCGVGNLVCVLDNGEGSFNDILTEMLEVSHW